METNVLKDNLRKIRYYLIVVALTALSGSCQIDRTTVVFGKVVDQNQQPVDSIMVLISGSNLSISEVELQSTYTDKNGEYEILIEVPKNYHNVNVDIPYLPNQNPKFQKKYKISKRIGNNSRPMIGRKTQWDFELEPK